MSLVRASEYNADTRTCTEAPTAAPPDMVTCDLEARTSRARWARSYWGEKHVQFLVGAEWTEPQVFFRSTG